MQCTYVEDCISCLIHTLHQMSKATEAFSNPKEMLDAYYASSIEDFTHRIFGNHSYLINDSSADWRDLVQEQEELIVPFVYSAYWDICTAEAPKRSRTKVDPNKIYAENMAAMFNPVRPQAEPMYQNMVLEDEEGEV